MNNVVSMFNKIKKDPKKAEKFKLLSILREAKEDKQLQRLKDAEELWATRRRIQSLRERIKNLPEV